MMRLRGAVDHTYRLCPVVHHGPVVGLHGGAPCWMPELIGERSERCSRPQLMMQVVLGGSRGDDKHDQGLGMAGVLTTMATVVAT